MATGVTVGTILSPIAEKIKRKERHWVADFKEYTKVQRVEMTYTGIQLVGLGAA